MGSTSRSDPFRSEPTGEPAGERIGEFAASDDAGPRLGEDAGEVEFAGEPDLYARLGVASDATPDELRRAYHRLVKLWHPDRYAAAPDAMRARAERRIRQLNEAYDTVSNPTSRAAYDGRRDGHGGPIGDVINVFGQRTAAPKPHADDVEASHASSNPNGAGQFFGALAAILALALIGGAVSGGGVGSAFVALVVVCGIIALLAAAAFFVTSSPLAQWATRFMEAEPRGAAEAVRQANHQATRRAQAASTPPVGATRADAATFNALIDEALTAVPHTFDEYMRNVVVRAEEEPDAETLRQAGVPPGHTLLGLYHGVSLTRRGAGEGGPEVITIYRGPIERYCGGDLERIRAQVRATVLHELAHHFGIDHDDMPEWVK